MPKPDRMSENLSKKYRLAGIIRRTWFVPKAPLHTEVCTQRRKFLHTDALYKDAFANLNKGTYIFTHRNFATEKPLHRTIFTQIFWHRNRHRENYTHRLHKKNTRQSCCTQKLYPEQFLHSRHFSAQKPSRTDFLNGQHFFLQTDGFYTESSPHRSLTHRRFYAQHSLHTDALIHRCLYTEDELHTKTSRAHRTLLHATSFYTQTQRRFPFLITYLSCSPSQVL